MVYTGAVKNLFGSIAGLEKTQYHFQLSDYDDFADCIWNYPENIYNSAE